MADQATFEGRVNEMSDLQRILASERRKLREYRQKLYKDLPAVQK